MHFFSKHGIISARADSSPLFKDIFRHFGESFFSAAHTKGYGIMASVVETVKELTRPITDEFGLDLWDVEFKKEGSSYFLRIFIDKDEGVSINDCENVSRAIDPILDEVDPIEQSYCLEVCSAGLVRELKTTAHINKFLGRTAEVGFYKVPEGLKTKKTDAVLISADDENITVKIGEEDRTFERKAISKIKIDLVD